MKAGGGVTVGVGCVLLIGVSVGAGVEVGDGSGAGVAVTTMIIGVGVGPVVGSSEGVSVGVGTTVGDGSGVAVAVGDGDGERTGATSDPASVGVLAGATPAKRAAGPPARKVIPPMTTRPRQQTIARATPPTAIARYER